LGQGYDLPTSDSVRLVRRALDAGVNFIDTAPQYGESEERLGHALRDVPRDQYYVCTKFQPRLRGGAYRSAADLRESIQHSLQALQTDVLDVLYLHGIGPDVYPEVLERYLPELIAARQAGLIRHIGITERYPTDHDHSMLQQAIRHGQFDVVMVGYNLLSPSAVTTILPLAAEHNVGIVVMCAVRKVLVDPTAVAAFVRQWEREGLLTPGTVEPDAALDWLIDDDTPDVAAAAYKFAAAPVEVGSVLTGTASLGHFEDNLAAVLGTPLPADKFQRVLDVFGPVQRNVEPAGVGR
jgi:aryl-alcohol dehydrogenase-like predicted oxidoreductase